ncbi:hypothetical protein [Bacillus multifaciens]|uniref:hypothetical protein n=1 Tax=Bacillus multifaciens TaxID=3068506 RepID=UPI002740E1DB|nr:hypothetical protein [Bacillus sp. WLY-B-L8]MDP7977478.1 hypothetical protein [Bacillus sp. WLY-B-L8]
MQSIYDYFDELQNNIFNLQPKDIELKYFEICKQLSGVAFVQDIYELNMNEYEEGLEDSFKAALRYLHDDEIKAIYFEYDMDNNWASEFYLCKDYNELSEEDDDWACDWDVHIEGPSLSRFAQMYQMKGGFHNQQESIGITLLLIVRTIVSFFNVVKKYNIFIPICIAYHDQYPIMRTEKD